MEPEENDQPTVKQLSDEELQLLVVEMRKLNLVKDRTYLLRKYPKCFVGSEVVIYLLSTPYVSNKEEAVILGQQLMDADLIHHVHDAHTFKDDNLFYRFREDEDNSSKGPSVAKVLKEGVVAIEGVLDVKSGLFWNKRYFVLRADEVKLYYFETNLSSAPSRIIDLSNSELEVAECSCKTGSYCFTIKEKKRSYVLCTDHSKVQLAWLQALTELGVKFLEEKIDPMGNSIFDFNANDIDGNHCPLAKFAGNVCLVVNVASY